MLILYKGQITGGTAKPGEEDVEEVGLFRANELPDNIAFDSNIQTLAMWRDGKL